MRNLEKEWEAHGAGRKGIFARYLIGITRSNRCMGLAFSTILVINVINGDSCCYEVR